MDPQIEYFALAAACAAMAGYAVRLESLGDKHGAEYYRERLAQVEFLRDCAAEKARRVLYQ